MNHYETVFILNPVLSDVQVKETVKKFEDYLVSKGAEMISKEQQTRLQQETRCEITHNAS